MTSPKSLAGGDTSPSFTPYQKFVVALLAFLQFTIILDFMIMSPMGALLIPVLKITPSQFGLVVSVYAFSAGISGILAAGFADRYDRKKFLMFFYVGFVFGTLICGIAPSYPFLLIGRMITGIFAGVIGSIVLAITTDVFSFDQRGQVVGYIQSAFAGSQILGIPMGLYLSNLWGWHMPFLMIVGISVVVGLVIFIYLRPVDTHLKKRVDFNAFHHLKATITYPKYLFAFASTALLSTGGFMLMPFGSAFSVNNLGIPMEKIPMMYLITGICTIFTAPLVGRASDRFGKFNVFIFGTILTIVMVLIYTNLGITPLPIAIMVNAILFVGIFSRMIPSQAMVSAIPAQTMRGSFMAISSSLQQVSGGIASIIAGWIVVQGVDGKLQNFDILGDILVVTSLITVVLMFYIHRNYVREANKDILL